MTEVDEEVLRLPEGAPVRVPTPSERDVRSSSATRSDGPVPIRSVRPGLGGEGTGK